MNPEIPATAPDPVEARTGRIADLAAGSATRHPVPWRGGYLKAPVINVPQSLLVYRVDNGRLIGELREHASRGGEDLQTLAARQEALDVQRLLHGLLVAKASDPTGPILQELERIGQQAEPLLITAEGVLINGNRRLAAMRQLLARDPDAYGAFKEVFAAVLPAEAGVADLEAVEAALQMAPETKLAYGWVSRRLKMRRQRDELGLSVEAICEASRLSGPAQLERELAELALAETYLGDYRREPGRYSLIGDAEKLFIGLNERLNLLPAELRETWRRAGFSMIAARAQISGPLDRHFPFAAPVPEHLPAWALRRFAEEREIIAARPDGGQSDALDASTLQSLNAIFADRSRSGELGPALFDLTERLRAEFREEHNPARMLKLLEKLHQTMIDLEPDQLDEHQRNRLRSQAAAFQAQLRVLLRDSEEGPGPLDLGSRVARLMRRRAR
jgi:hypothetical protein